MINSILRVPNHINNHIGNVSIVQNHIILGIQNIFVGRYRVEPSYQILIFLHNKVAFGSSNSILTAHNNIKDLGSSLTIIRKNNGD